jgi:hypothetical protein
MKALILAFCEWCNASFFGRGIRDSVWLFPFVEIFHLIALGLLGGTIIVLNLRLVGLRFNDEPAAKLADELRPWTIGSLVVMLASGFLLFSTEAVKMYGNWAFQLKMSFLLLAVLFTFTVQSRVIRAEARVAPRWRLLTAAVSTLLWIGVGLGGRAIGYVTTAAPSGGP